MRYSKMADSVMTLQCYSAEIGVTWQPIDVLEVIWAVTNRDSAVSGVLESGPGMRKGVTTKSSPSGGEIRFGAFEFGPETGELRKHGLRIKLRGQPIEVLTMLLQHPGEAVAREELQKRLWTADTYVDF